MQQRRGSNDGRITKLQCFRQTLQMFDRISTNSSQFSDR